MTLAAVDGLEGVVAQIVAEIESFNVANALMGRRAIGYRVHVADNHHLILCHRPHG